MAEAIPVELQETSQGFTLLRGGETVSFGVGLPESDRAHPDSAITKTKDIVLSSEWRLYRAPLNGLDLSSIKTGFVVNMTGRATPVAIFLDDIRYVP